jgi:hypothetical protein
VEALAVAPDGAVLVAGYNDGTVCLWDTPSGQEVGRLTPHAGPVKALAFSARGKRLASGGADGTAVVWDLPALLEAARPHLITLTAGELEALWKDLASDDADKAYQAVRPLVSAAPQTVPLFKERLRPVTEDIRQLIADLDDNRFAVRQKATQDLSRLGKYAEAALRKALEGNPSPESRRRIEQLLQRLEDGVPSPERARALRALEVLERIGTPEARSVLETLAGGAPEAELTVEAKTTLQRPAKRR